MASTWAQILKLLVGRSLKKPLMFINDDLSPTIRYISFRRNLPRKEAEKERAGKVYRQASGFE